MLTVACVLKSGGIYDATWVARLRVLCLKYVPEHQFVILTDVLDFPDDCGGCKRIELRHGWPGWWSKLELFRPDLADGTIVKPGPVLFFDLDTLPIGDLSELAEAATRFDLIMLRDFYRADGLGSGAMAWSSQETVAPIYEAFQARPKFFMECYRGGGDQSFIESCINLKKVTRWQDAVGDQIVSYKVHCRNGIPPNARVVCFHGRPKFGDLPANDPVRQAWEIAA